MNIGEINSQIEALGREERSIRNRLAVHGNDPTRLDFSMIAVIHGKLWPLKAMRDSLKRGGILGTAKSVRNGVVTLT